MKAKKKPISMKMINMFELDSSKNWQSLPRPQDPRGRTFPSKKIGTESETVFCYGSNPISEEPKPKTVIDVLTDYCVENKLDQPIFTLVTVKDEREEKVQGVQYSVKFNGSIYPSEVCRTPKEAKIGVCTVILKETCGLTDERLQELLTPKVVEERKDEQAADVQEDDLKKQESSEAMRMESPSGIDEDIDQTSCSIAEQCTSSSATSNIECETRTASISSLYVDPPPKDFVNRPLKGELERQLYVYNIPPTCREVDLLEFLHKTIHNYGLQSRPGFPVHACVILNHPQQLSPAYPPRDSHAVVEFRSIMEASKLYEANMRHPLVFQGCRLEMRKAREVMRQAKDHRQGISTWMPSFTIYRPMMNDISRSYLRAPSQVHARMRASYFLPPRPAYPMEQYYRRNSNFS